MGGISSVGLRTVFRRVVLAAPVAASGAVVSVFFRLAVVRTEVLRVTPVRTRVLRGATPSAATAVLVRRGRGAAVFFAGRDFFGFIGFVPS